MKGKACLPSIATIVHHLANFPVNKKPFTTINIRALSQNILAKASIADPEHKSKLWDIVAAIFVRSLTTYNTKTKSRSTAIQITSNDRSRTVKQSQQPVDFLKFCYLNSLKHHNLQITPDPFNAPDPKSVLLKLTANNKLVILRTIAHEANYCRRKDIFVWCISEMIKNGVTTEEIELDWNTCLLYTSRCV